MNIKKDIYSAFIPPEPKDRDMFLSKISYPKLSFIGFVLEQAAYIRKRIWVISAAILLLGIFSVCFIPWEFYASNALAGVWAVSSLIPFLAMLTASEVSRSDIYKMSEIEAGSKFGIAQLVTARLLILGICNFIVISSFILISGIFSPLGIVRSAIFIMAPFSVVSGISLAVQRRFRGQEGIYLSAASALGVSVLEFVFTSMPVYIMSNAGIAVSIVACFAAIVAVIANIKKIYNGDKNYGINY